MGKEGVVKGEGGCGQRGRRVWSKGKEGVVKGEGGGNGV